MIRYVSDIMERGKMRKGAVASQSDNWKRTDKVTIVSAPQRRGGKGAAKQKKKKNEALKLEQRIEFTHISLHCKYPMECLERHSFLCITSQT